MSKQSVENDAALIERACEVMHDAYEAAAVTEGWETQQRSRKPWADVPEANKATMRAAVAALLDWLPVRDALGRLDGTDAAAVSLLTGLSREELGELGSVPETRVIPPTKP